MKFLITGADGLLGNNLVRELLASGHAVRVLLQPRADGRSLSELNIEKTHADITSDLATLDESMKGCDGVFHCAAITDLLAPHDVADLVNVIGTRNIIEACLKNQVKRLVFVGSASSFQFGTRPCPGDETGGFAPAYKGMSYMESKHAAMKLVHQYIRERGLDAVTVAPTFMLGPYDTRPSSGELIRQHINRNLRFTSCGGRNFVHVRDVAQGMILAFEKGKCGESYILGHQNLSYVEFFKMVNRVIGRKSKQYILPKPVVLLAGFCSQVAQKLTRKKTLFNYQISKMTTLETYYSPKKAVLELGMPQTPIEVAIDDSLRGLKAYGHIIC